MTRSCLVGLSTFSSSCNTSSNSWVRAIFVPLVRTKPICHLCDSPSTISRVMYCTDSTARQTISPGPMHDHRTSCITRRESAEVHCCAVTNHLQGLEPGQILRTSQGGISDILDPHRPPPPGQWCCLGSQPLGQKFILRFIVPQVERQNTGVKNNKPCVSSAFHSASSIILVLKQHLEFPQGIVAVNFHTCDNIDCLLFAQN